MSPRGNRKSLQLKGRVIFFATNNVNKFDEARSILAGYNVAVGMLRVKSLEVQSESLEEIARMSAFNAFEKCRLPIIVEDAGLFIDALNGFPGPYAAYVYKTVGNRGLLRLMKNLKARSAHFESAVAYFSADMESPVCFHGEVLGEIADRERRKSDGSSFGFDPIFKPLDSSKTFAEMNIVEKNEHSHRARALRKFAEWYRS